MTTRRRFVAGASALAYAAKGGAALAATAQEVTSVYQPGIGYMPFIELDRTNALTNEFPGTHFSWRVLSNGAAIRDGFVSNTIQIGAVGSAPFLIGWDRGVPWKIVCVAVNYDFWLVVMDPNIKSLKDLKPGDKIATPSPDAINSLVLRAALERQGLPANYLDVGMVAMAHPLAEQALLSRQVVAHIATPPFAQDEVRKGGHVIMHTADAFPGGFSSTLVVASTTFAQEQKPILNAFFKQYVAAVKSIQAHPDDAAKAYVEANGGKGDLAEVTSLFRQLSPSIFSIAPKGVMETARFMAKHGLIKKVPASFAEISLGYVDREAT